VCYTTKSVLKKNWREYEMTIVRTYALFVNPSKRNASWHERWILPLSLPSHQAFTEISNFDMVSTPQNKNTYKNQPWRKHHGVGPFPEPSELLSFQTPASVTPRWDPSSSLPWPHSGEMDLSPQLTWMGSYHSSHKLSCQLHCSENKMNTVT